MRFLLACGRRLAQEGGQQVAQVRQCGQRQARHFAQAPLRRFRERHPQRNVIALSLRVGNHHDGGAAQGAAPHADHPLPGQRMEPVMDGDLLIPNVGIVWPSSEFSWERWALSGFEGVGGNLAGRQLDRALVRFPTDGCGGASWSPGCSGPGLAGPWQRPIAPAWQTRGAVPRECRTGS